MRGGILLACHHGLDDAQIDHMQTSFAAFADSRLLSRPLQAVAV
jgi:CDP-6-deoxy-D-xylo-4-hexulose-3-dehydrase